MTSTHRRGLLMSSPASTITTSKVSISFCPGIGRRHRPSSPREPSRPNLRPPPNRGPHRMLSLRAQADLYLRKGARSGRTLHVVFGGGNDVLGAIGDPEASRAIGRAAESLRSIVADLLAPSDATIWKSPVHEQGGLRTTRRIYHGAKSSWGI